MNSLSSNIITLACRGDLMIGNQTLAALAPNGIQAKADQIWQPLEGTDIVVANIEAPITNRVNIRENKRYNLKTGSEILDLFDSRFVLGLANNHIYIWLSIVHYADIGRRQGIWSSARTIVAGVRSQLVKKEC